MSETPNRAEIFEAALSLDASARPAFLDHACAGNPELRADVEDLLRWHERAELGTEILPASPVLVQSAAALTRAASLASGRFGRFWIESKRGEGSSAIVYRAIDTGADRVVALKVGNARTILDPDSRRRFEQAASATAHLEHPHIARVLANGVEMDIPWLALEFVDGRTLAEVLHGEKLDLASSLKIARQVAEALAAAHTQGIVHRDLKPANIMIGTDGDAKVLDFGLCHAVPGRETIAGTQSGLLAGTPGYLAPELARGMPPTPASDLFSFGAVLYEMLTGAPAFRGETTVATLSSVLHDPPPPMRGVPYAVQRLVEKCLEKQPAQRPPGAAEVAAQIALLERGLADGRVRVRPAWDGLRSRTRRIHFRVAVGLAAGALILGALAVALSHWLPSVRAPEARQITFDDAVLNTEPAASPDRRWIAFASDRSGEGNLDLWIVATGPAANRQPRRLTKHEINVRQPEFSPDGRTLLYRSDRNGGGIFKINLDSAPAATPPPMIVPHGLHPKFSPDGKRFAYWVGKDTSGDVLAPGGGKIYVLNATGGQPQQVCPDFASAAYPVWSPDGQSILFAGRRGLRMEYQDPFVWMSAADACAPVGMARPWDFPDSQMGTILPQRWLSANRLLFRKEDASLANALVEVQVSGAPGGNEMHTAHIISPVNLASLANELPFAYSRMQKEANLWSIPVGAPSDHAPPSVPARVVSCASENCIPAFSRDGTMLFFSRLRAIGWEFVERDLSGATETVVAPPAIGSPWPFVIGPTRDLVFSRNATAEVMNVLRVSGKARRQAVICYDCPEPWDVSASGRFLLGMAGKERRTIVLVDTQTRNWTEILSHPQWNLYRASFSPDEHSILFTAKISPDRSVIYAADFSGARSSPPESWMAISEDTEYNGPARWSAGGDRIYFTSERDGHRCFYMRGWNRRRHVPEGPIVEIRHFHAEAESPGLIPQSLFGFAVSSDRIVFEMGRRTGNIWAMN